MESGRYRVGLAPIEGEAADARTGFALNLFRFSDGETLRVTAIEHPADFGLAVSPDGRRVLYPQWDQLEADLILQTIAE